MNHTAIVEIVLAATAATVIAVAVVGVSSRQAILQQVLRA